MIIDVFTLRAKEGEEKKLEEAYIRMQRAFSDAEGLLSQLLLRRRRLYLIVSRWRNIKDLKNFRENYPFDKYKDIINIADEATARHGKARQYKVINQIPS